jgi:hypothetical protein
MEDSKVHLGHLSEIRSMMEQSTKFISLSGLSGVAAGICALIGSLAAYIYLEIDFLDNHYYDLAFDNSGRLNTSFFIFFLVNASLVLILTLAFGLFFTLRKAKRKNQSLWNASSKRLLFHLAIPLIAGGLFCFILFFHGYFGLIAPATLVFYGLALLNAGKYTLHDIQYLGIAEIILGLVASIFIGYGLLFWAFGFGVLHIVYGAVMYWKYDR